MSNNRSRNNKANQNAGSRGGKKKSKRKSKKFDPAKFWGDPTEVSEVRAFRISSPDPSAAIASLGQPPLPGQGAVSQKYFKVVCTRASQLAGALAHAGGLPTLETTEASTDPEQTD